MRQNSLRYRLFDILKNYYALENIYMTEDYIYAAGEIPVALVAHLDTVHTEHMQDLYHDSRQRVLWSPQGIGADDRAGIWAIIQILRRGYRPTVIFCADEERGGIGAITLSNNFPKPITPVNFLVELDRHGVMDAVYYDCANEKFETYINAFGFITAWGSFTDISFIAPQWGIAAVNLSIGYENEHSLAETWYYDNTLWTINKVINILEAEMVEEHPFEYIPFVYPDIEEGEFFYGCK